MSQPLVDLAAAAATAQALAALLQSGASQQSNEIPKDSTTDSLCALETQMSTLQAQIAKIQSSIDTIIATQKLESIKSSGE
jgi:hypothetical protein